MTERLTEELRARIAASAPLSPDQNISVAEEGVPVVTLLRDPSTRTGFDENLDRVGTAVGVCVDGVLSYVSIINAREEIDPIVNTDLEADVRNVLNISARYRSGDNIRLVLSNALPGVTAYVTLPDESVEGKELLLTSVHEEISIRSMPDFINWAREIAQGQNSDEDGDGE